MEIHAGVARSDITYLKRGVGLLGWGHFENKAYGVETPLNARAFVFYTPEDKRKMVWVCADLCFITNLVKQEVCYRLEEDHPQLGFNDQNVLLTATHTHSAPGGYSVSLIYNLPNASVVPEVFETYVRGIVRAIVAANERVVPAKLTYDVEAFAPEIQVAFNRSYHAYNRNKEMKEQEKITHKTRHLALDRNMYLLRIDNQKGTPMGLINWFGVHATCIKNKHEVISSDNKGYCSDLLEREISRKFSDCDHFVAACAQNTAGDVSPNFVKHRGMREITGPFRDDFENRTLNATLQMEHAYRLFIQAEKGTPITGPMDWVYQYVNMSKVQVESKYADGEEDARTGEASMGTHIFAGTNEGKGAPWPVVALFSFLTWLMGRRNKKVHGNKYMAIEGESKRWLGFRRIYRLPVPGSVHPILQMLKTTKRNPILDREPILPHIMPLQVITLGKLALVALPTEPSTMTGRRITQSVRPHLEKKGCEHIVIAGYSNAYSGYATTREEYAVQHYEGAHTLFGKWTAAAYEMLCVKLSQALLQSRDQRQVDSLPRPDRIRVENLVPRKFSYYRWQMKTFARTRRRLRNVMGGSPRNDKR